MRQDSISNQIVLRQATISDIDLLLRWRNDYRTRLASRNTDTVDEHTHRAWLQTALTGKKCRLLIAEIANVPVGTVRIDFDDVYELSWTVDPRERGKGIGKRMVLYAIRDLSSPIRATIRVSNIASRKIAESLGFHLVADDGQWQTFMLNPESMP